MEIIHQEGDKELNMYYEADWENISLIPHGDKENIIIRIPSISILYKNSKNSTVSVNNVTRKFIVPLSRKKHPYRIPVLHVKGGVNLYFELLQDRDEIPIYVLGFKQSSISEPSGPDLVEILP
ncbi:MAG: hypothetical protein AAF632_29835 [Bacteroidota bacterium]